MACQEWNERGQQQVAREPLPVTDSAAPEAAPALGVAFGCWQYDARAHAAYLRLTSAPVDSTQTVGRRVHVDLDADGNAVGIEVLGFYMAEVI